MSRHQVPVPSCTPLVSELGQVEGKHATQSLWRKHLGLKESQPHSDANPLQGNLDINAPDLTLCVLSSWLYCNSVLELGSSFSTRYTCQNCSSGNRFRKSIFTQKSLYSPSHGHKAYCITCQESKSKLTI